MAIDRWARPWGLAAFAMMLGVGTADATRAEPVFAVAGDGFTAGSIKVHFGAPRAQAIATAAKALGKPVKTGSHGECGQGDVIAYASFSHDFELSFINGKLSGWTEDSANLATTKGVRVGMTVAALRKAYPDVMTDPGDETNGGLGPSFQREGGPNGWIDGVKASSRITGMYAGATCLSGV